MKKILGLDLGIGSIGWALVNEAEKAGEYSSIVTIGTRVNPLTIDEQQNFENGKSITTNADRTLKRSMRRNLQRYKLRRSALVNLLREYGWINANTPLYECGNRSTFETYRLRAKAASEEITLEQFARVLLMINKKRGYKSSRKAKSQEEGLMIDGMAIAKELYDSGQTPGEYVYARLLAQKKYIPSFYRSDLLEEFDRIWAYQSRFYPKILTDAFKDSVRGKSSRVTAAAFKERYSIYTSDVKGKDKQLNLYALRSSALNDQLDITDVATALCEVNAAIANSSGYLGEISDRSKALHFNHQTVGQYLVTQLDKDSSKSLKNKVFYRQDYLDEFEIIWETQVKFHPELTPQRKKEIRDMVIFYQRALKSQKGLVACCELESRTLTYTKDGQPHTVTVSPKVCPKSSFLFQEFKIWQVLNDLLICNEDTGEKRPLYAEEKAALYAELSIKKSLSKAEALKVLSLKAKTWNLNRDKIGGNATQAALFAAYQTIIAMSGHGEHDFSKMSASQVREIVEGVFGGLGFNTSVLTYDTSLPNKEMGKQDAFRLWHLLYSYDDGKAASGTEGLVEKIATLLHCEKEYAKVLANVTFPPDYGNLSAKAISKLLPHMREGLQYSAACEAAEYRHSKRSLTADELKNKECKDHLSLLPHNSLRNPVVEKILNQMINVVNQVVNVYGKPDEIRVEMARELKKSAKEREQKTVDIAKATAENERIKAMLQAEFGIAHVSRNDIIRYKLYEELRGNGYKTLYSNTYISREKLFGKEFDIEHIVPKARLFDDSFSNKTLEAHAVNIEKDDLTAINYVERKYGADGVADYKKRVNDLYENGAISWSKRKNLLMKASDIPTDFLNRDLRDTQYIARKAHEILEELVPAVTATTGAVTDRLRKDWGLIDVMQELNWDKYDKLGLTEEWPNKDGRRIRRIKDWTKRNDHRHHAMDALVIAFTKPSYIQYLNNMNARSDKTGSIYGIEQKELFRDNHNKLRFKAPFINFRNEAKRHLEHILVSVKAKNKVVTRNINKLKRKQGGTLNIVQLTPRGQLHNETVYGSIRCYVTTYEKVGGNFGYGQIAHVCNQQYRNALLRRLDAFGGDTKKAFTGKNSLDKNPLYLEDNCTMVPMKVKTVRQETIYTIRKDVNKDLNVDKVVDKRIREILKQRLQTYGNDPKKAFVNLEENPIWLNEEKHIAIKRVTITGVSNAVALHDKKDMAGEPILNEAGQKQPVDFVNTNNNHHVAIFCDASGNWQEHIVSFYEAVERANQHLPVIDKEYKQEEGWQFLFTMKQNEYFVFPNPATGFNPEEMDLKNPENYALISPNLFRVQALTKKDYKFRHHLETTVVDINSLRDITWKRIRNENGLKGIVKVRINHIGQIVAVGEY